MSQRPVAISMLLCEQVIVDVKTRNATPVNCFNTRHLEAIPGHVSFTALVWLTDGMGEVIAEVIVERLDSMEEVFRVEEILNFANPLQEMRCAVRIRRCPIPVAGYYLLSLIIDREVIADRRFAVRKEEK